MAEFAEVKSELRRLVDEELVDGQEDGTFWMDFEDFSTYFWEVGIMLAGLKKNALGVPDQKTFLNSAQV